MNCLQKLISRLLENKKMYILGIDVSKWQDDNSTPQMMDFNKSKEAGANYVLIKTSQATWLDQDYTINWLSAKLAGLPRGGYHYLDWTTPAVTQARFFYGVLKEDIGELRPVLDFECRKNVPVKSIATKAAYDFVTEFERLSGVKPVIYTSPSYWLEFGSTDSFWKQFRLWIANYYVNSPTIPSPWDKWYMWQYTDKGDGIAFGAESYGLDMNWFNNVDYDFDFDYEVPSEPPEEPETPDEFPYDIITTASWLNIRTEPKTTSTTKIGAVPLNTKFTAVGKENDWYKIIAYVYGNYIKKI